MINKTGKSSDPIPTANVKPLCHDEDVNSDGIDDLVCHFVTIDIMGVDGTSMSAMVSGELLDGTVIEGTDTVNIVKDTCN